MAATICPKCGHLEHKSRMHQNICTHYIPAYGAECGCSYQRPQPDPAEAERKPGNGRRGQCGSAFDLGLHRECPRCAIAGVESVLRDVRIGVERIYAASCISGYDSGNTEVAAIARKILDRISKGIPPSGADVLVQNYARKDAALEELLAAAKSPDWGQVVANGGPPCFHIEGARFCLRAERWEGHGIFHPYTTLYAAIAKCREVQK